MGAGRRHRAHALYVARDDRDRHRLRAGAARRDGARRRAASTRAAGLPSASPASSPWRSRRRSGCRRRFPAAARPSSARGRPGGSSPSPRPRSASPGCCSTRNVWLQIGGVVLIALPHIVGAPHPHEFVSTAPAELAGHFAADLAGRDGDLLGGARLRLGRLLRAVLARPDEERDSCSCSAARAPARAPTPRSWSRRAGSSRSMSRPPSRATRRWRSASPSIARAAAPAWRTVEAPRRAGGGARRARQARGGRCSSTA